MRKLERIAYLKYMKKLVEQEIEQIQREISIDFEEPVEVGIGKIQSQRNNAYTFDNDIVSEVIGDDMFRKLAKISKSSISAVASPIQMTEISKNAMVVQPSAPFLKLTQVHYPSAKMAVKIGDKFRTIFKLI